MKLLNPKFYVSSLATATAAFLAIGLMPSAQATILVTEPFDYTVGVHAGPWGTTLGHDSGIGWGTNAWGSHIGDSLNFGIATGGHTGTFADSTGLDYLSGEWRQRNLASAVHSNTDGAVIWQHLSMSRSGTGTAGKLTTENPNGGMQFAVRIEADGTYGLGAGQRNTTLASSTIQASESATAPDVIVVKMENQTGGTGLFDVSLWINPTATTAAELPSPDLQILGTSPFSGNRQIGSINWMAGNTQIDNFILASAYEDFGIGSVVSGPLISVKNGAVSLTDNISTVNFGSTVIGVAVDKTFTITNDGTADLTLGVISQDGADNADFSVGAPVTNTLSAGTSTTFTVTFTPSAATAKTASIHIANDSPGALNPFDIALTGTGLPPISVRQGSSTLTDGSATPVNFGSSVVGVAVSKIFTITNDGTTDLTLGTISQDGTGIADFSVGAPETTTIIPGASTTFTVTFTPSAADTKNAAIHIANNAPGDANPFDIALTGTGHVLGATIVVTEPFDYTVGSWTSVAGSAWTTLMGSSSGTGWGTNNWFSHVGAGLGFKIATDGHTGTFADSTGLNYISNGFRERAMDPSVHSNTGGDVIWQHLTMSITATGTAGQLFTQNANGGGNFAVRVEADGTYTLLAEHGGAKSQTSTIQASLSATAPDVIVVKMENQIGTGLFDVSLWVNPTATTAAGLPAPDLQILGATPYAGNLSIKSINWMPGTTQIDNFILAGDYADIAPQGSLALAANAGADKALSPGTPSAVLGGSPAAIGGTSPYTYSWSPSTGLDNDTLANPTVTTTDATTTYTLTVTDSASPDHATQTDEVIVTYSVPPLVANAGPDKNVSSVTPSVVIGGSPSASGGSSSYTYSWTPTTGLTGADTANPTAAPTETTIYTLTLTDSLGTPLATDSVTVSYVTAPPALLVSESFDYTDGAALNGLNGGTGWAGAWTGNAASTISGTGLTYTQSTVALAASGGKLQSLTGSGSRVINTASGSPAELAGVVDGSGNIGADGTSVWVAFLGQCPTGPNFEIAFTRPGAGYGVPQTGNYEGNWRFWPGYNSTGLSAADKVLMVWRIDFASGSDTCRVWYNPQPGTQPNDADGFAAENGQDWSFNQLSFQGDTSATLHLDELRVGTTYAAVAPQETLVLPTKLVYTSVPATGTVGTPFSVTIESQNDAGTAVNVSSATTVALGIASGGGELSGITTGTIPAGSHSVTIDTPIYSMADTLTLTASATEGMTGLTAATSSDIVFSARSAYDLWSEQITDRTKIGPDDDADGDGAPNLVEFAFNGDPNNAADNGGIYSFENVLSGAKAMVLTVAVLKTTDAFSTADSPVGTNAAAGITYTIQGSSDLSFPNVKVEPITPAVVYPLADPPYMPNLDTTDYEYRSFKLSGSEDLTTKGFLRAMVTQP